jgi:hypothetical protein
VEGAHQFSQLSMQKMTKAQEKIWNVLQDEKNRVLPIEKICHLAGYRSNNVRSDILLAL